MRRSLAIARYLFPKHIEIIPRPADDNNTRRDNWMSSDEGRNRAIAEVIMVLCQDLVQIKMRGSAS